MNKGLDSPLLAKRIKEVTEYGELLDDLYELKVRAAALLKEFDHRTMNGEDPGRLPPDTMFLFILPSLRQAVQCT